MNDISSHLRLYTKMDFIKWWSDQLEVTSY